MCDGGEYVTLTILVEWECSINYDGAVRRSNVIVLGAVTG